MLSHGILGSLEAKAVKSLKKKLRACPCDTGFIRLMLDWKWLTGKIERSEHKHHTYKLVLGYLSYHPSIPDFFPGPH